MAQNELIKMVDEFKEDYLSSEQGRKHFEEYNKDRQRVTATFGEIRDARERGEDSTDVVLDYLLPIKRESVAPAGFKTIKAFGWSDEELPQLADAVFDLIHGLIQHPNDTNVQRSIIRAFVSSPYQKGLQAGTISAVLYALDPNYSLINSKVVDTFNYISGELLASEVKISTRLEEYVDNNKRLTDFLREVSQDIPEFSDPDVFDMFSHWLVAVKAFDFRPVRYWKIAPGRRAWNWDACRGGGFIAVGWEGLGDVSGLSRSEFDRRRDQILAKHPDWTKARLDQVWTFAHLNEGDRIVANRGTTEVLGIGTVVGPYYFVEGQRHGHRLPVQWDDLTVRQVDRGGWRRTIVSLSPDEFEGISHARPVQTEPHPECPFSDATFEALAQLHGEPTYDFYNAHKESLHDYVIEPFKQLMMDVRDRLPAVILEKMETKKRVFASILKQFVKHGCWDFYWGAFYPKGGKRIQDAQLFLWMNRDRLEFGFYIGEYGGEQRARFLRNCADNREVLARVLADSLADDGLLFGPRDDFVRRHGEFDRGKTWPSFEDWITSLAETDIHAAVFLPKDQVLQRSQTQLAEDIADVYERLFPLVLLATLDDPMPAIGDYLTPPEPDEINPQYSLAECANDTYFDQAVLTRWVRAIERKGQAIIYGPPGTGKTYIAERLARHLIGGADGFYDVVQFHPAYAYEDFVQGIRPRAKADGQLEYPVVAGRFLEFCERAKASRGRCVLIIDEINRANLARVLGELMYLLEYRDREVPLAAGKSLRIPANVRIIGTMNTADRSIALVDHALRRRFAFLALYPEYDILRRYHQQTGFDVEPLIGALHKLNRQIGDRHYEVGITFFLREDVVEQMEDIWRMEIEPYLEEYFFDQPDKADDFRWERVGEGILS